MKKRLIIGLLSVSVIAVMVALVHQKEVGAVTCAKGYTHYTYQIPSGGLEKHGCKLSTNGSLNVNLGLWGISSQFVGLGIRATIEGPDPGNPNEIPAVVFCRNKGNNADPANGQPFLAQGPITGTEIFDQGDCRRPGRCEDTVTLDADAAIFCPNRNWTARTIFLDFIETVCVCAGGYDFGGNCCASFDRDNNGNCMAIAPEGEGESCNTSTCTNDISAGIPEAPVCNPL